MLTCAKCEVSSKEVDGCYHDGIGWLCDPHFEEFQQLIENFIQPKRKDLSVVFSCGCIFIPGCEFKHKDAEHCLKDK